MKQLLRSPGNNPDFLVVGLGNPGNSYRKTRHNVGFRVIDLLAEPTGVRFKKPIFGRYLIGTGRPGCHTIVLVKPLTYMNRSGEVLPGLLKKTGLSQDRLIVICDTLDLEPGMCRLKRKGGSAGHKGIASIIEQTGSGDFLRFYIGVGRPEDKSGVVDHVLGIPGKEDELLIRSAEKAAAEAVLRLLEESLEQVMHEFNRRKNPTED